jgi:hypothetical protein
MFSLKRSNITSLSPFAVFDENTMTSINDIEVQASWSVYPNPAKDILYLNLDPALAGEYFVEIVNINGQVVSSARLVNNNTAVSLNGLSNGNYFIRLYNDRVKLVKPFAKM